MSEEIIGVPVELAATSFRIKKTTGLYIALKFEDMEKFRQQHPEADEYVDVEVMIDGRHTQMSYEEFTRRLFMELPA